MPVNPPESCGLCKVVKTAVEKANNSVRKHLIIYSVAYLLIMEVASLFLAKLPNYGSHIFPIMCQMGYAFIFYTIWLHRVRLKFCLRKDFAVFFLCLYYAFNAITILFQICGSVYTQIVSYGLLSSVLLLLLLTIFKRK